MPPNLRFTDSVSPQADMSDAMLNAKIAEYEAISTELLACNKNAHDVYAWGTRGTLTLLAAGLGSLAFERDLEGVRALFFMLLVPLFLVVVFFSWAGELKRQQRAGTYLATLEKRINRCVAPEGEPAAMLWYHHFLGPDPETPGVEGTRLMFGHYRNLALGLVALLAISESIGAWSLANYVSNGHLQALLEPVPFVLLFLILALFRQESRSSSPYDLFLRIFNRAWASWLLIGLRAGIYATILMRLAGILSIDDFYIAYLAGWALVSDVLDGFLARRYAGGQELKHALQAFANVKGRPTSEGRNWYFGTHSNSPMTIRRIQLTDSITDAVGLSALSIGVVAHGSGWWPVLIIPLRECVYAGIKMSQRIARPRMGLAWAAYAAWTAIAWVAVVNAVSFQVIGEVWTGVGLAVGAVVSSVLSVVDHKTRPSGDVIQTRLLAVASALREGKTLAEVLHGGKSKKERRASEKEYHRWRIQSGETVGWTEPETM